MASNWQVASLFLLILGSGISDVICTGASRYKSNVLNGKPQISGPGGSLTLAVGTTFPVLNGLGIGAATILLEPCGVVPPHTHPRATEFLIVVSGTVKVGLIDDSGAVLTNILKAGQSTVFPKGLAHFQQNVGSGKAMMYVGFNSENPGTLLLPSALLSLPADVVGASLNVKASEVTALAKGLGPIPVKGNVKDGTCTME